MLNLRRKNAVHGGAVYAHFFRARERADFVNMHCACACYMLTQEGSEVLKSNWGARLESIIAHCAIFARAGPRCSHFQVNRKGVYMTSFKRDYELRLNASPESAFCTNHVQKRTILCVLNQCFETAFIRK